MLKRPIGVIMSFIMAIFLGLMAAMSLPVGLLPDAEIPELLIKVEAEGYSPQDVENNILSIIRKDLMSLERLKDLESKSSNNEGVIRLYFDHGTKMDFIYLEVNEIIDRLSSVFPDNIPRPKIIKINSTDLPMLTLHVMPNFGVDFVQTSKLVKNTIKRRLEQIAGVSLVDYNGMSEEVISIKPQIDKMDALGVNIDQLVETIERANINLGTILLKDGQMSYNLNLSLFAYEESDIANLTLRLPSDDLVSLKHVANVERASSDDKGSHYYNSHKAIAINIHKKHDAVYDDVREDISDLVSNLESEYEGLSIKYSQDQHRFLKASIGSLKSNLFFGGIFAFIVLFVFMGNWRAPLLIGILIPVSFILTFLCFYLLNVSINIISLSGMTLGLGMMIDNGIIVIESISNRLKLETNRATAICKGVSDVAPSLISSSLTTIAVFVPLIYMDGWTGALFTDQAMAIALTLGMSLLTSFILIPILSNLFIDDSSQQVENIFYLKVRAYYRKMYDWINAKKHRALVLSFSLLFPAICVVFIINVDSFPEIENKNFILEIDWKEPIHISENEKRKNEIDSLLMNFIQLNTSNIGLTQYSQQLNYQSYRRSSFYLEFLDESSIVDGRKSLRTFMDSNYPNAVYNVVDAPNSFNMLFKNSTPYLEARIYNNRSNYPLSSEKINAWKDKEAVYHALDWKGMQESQILEASIKMDHLNLYNINFNEFKKSLLLIGKENIVAKLRNYGEVKKVLLRSDNANLSQQLKGTFVKNNDNILFPISKFIDLSYSLDFDDIYADNHGVFQSIIWQDANGLSEIEHLKSHCHSIGTITATKGQFIDNQLMLSKLIKILCVCLLLLYFILAAQFESLLQPMIVVLTIPLGISGALLLLYLTNNTLNVMSLMGIIIMLGVLVNDSILKIDATNKIIKNKKNDYDVSEALKMSGNQRLKPILMTTITTILAVLPVLFSSNLGADLQQSLVISIVGGLTVGTVSALFVVPSIYKLFYKPIWKS